MDKAIITVAIEIDPAKVISDPQEWAGNTQHRNDARVKEALLQWAETTEEGQRLMALAQEYQSCRSRIIKMMDKGDTKAPSFSKEEAEKAMARVKAIQEEVGGGAKHLTESGLNYIYDWIMAQQ